MSHCRIFAKSLTGTFALLVNAALIFHLAIGCCWHHHHQLPCQVRVDTGSSESTSSDCNCSHGRLSTAFPATISEGSDPDPRGGTHDHGCSEPDCVLSLSNLRTVGKDLDDSNRSIDLAIPVERLPGAPQGYVVAKSNGLRLLWFNHSVRVHIALCVLTI